MEAGRSYYKFENMLLPYKLTFFGTTLGGAHESVLRGMGSRELLGATESDTVTVIGNVTIPGTTESVTVTIIDCTEHYAVTVIGIVTIGVIALSSSESVTQSSSLLKSFSLN